VAAVWVSALSSDQPGDRPAGVLADERVTHIDDGDGEIATFLGEHPELGVGTGFVYDAYLLFAADGDFAALTEHVEASGRTIIDGSEALGEAFAASG
jgi:hypothetical protein